MFDIENKIIILRTQAELNDLLNKIDSPQADFESFPCIFYAGVGFNRGTYTLNGIEEENIIKMKTEDLGIMKVEEFRQNS